MCHEAAESSRCDERGCVAERKSETLAWCAFSSVATFWGSSRGFGRLRERVIERDSLSCRIVVAEALTATVSQLCGAMFS